MFDFALESMIQQQLVSRGIRDQRVIRAFRAVSRKTFVPEYLHHRCYSDEHLPIGLGQTISPPHVVAWMLQEAEIAEGARVLEVGTGSGYVTALLGKLAADVFSLELLPELSARARKVLCDDLGYSNVAFRVSDGFQGWSAEAPFDAIVVHGAAEEVPWPLVGQLRMGAKLVMPIAQEDAAPQVSVYTRDDDGDPVPVAKDDAPSSKFSLLDGEARE